jgi:hypothetical protein
MTPNTRDPELSWRRFHGRFDEFDCLAHVALRFLTLRCSEADIERLLSEQKRIQRQFVNACANSNKSQFLDLSKTSSPVRT